MCAIRVIAANRQHRHLQFALGDELLIVDSVLREGGVRASSDVGNRRSSFELRGHGKTE
jgi:hypothetical protein